MIKVRFNLIAGSVIGRLCLGFIFVIFFHSCTEENVAQADFTIELEQSTKNDGLVKWQEGYAHVDGVNFSGQMNNGLSTAYSPITEVISLNGNEAAFGRVFISSGNYSNVKLIYEFQRAGTGEQGLLLIGDYRGTPVELHVNELISIEASTVDVDFLQNQLKTGKGFLDAAALFATVKETDLDNATKVSGKIIIAKNPNLSIYNKVVAQFENSIIVSF
ncbi:MAG: hypothetical protein ACJATA_000459 [Sphingobacteriales bacterium]|jgi:hypothetical protein